MSQAIRFIAVGLVLGGLCLALAAVPSPYAPTASAKPVGYQLPEETARFKQAPGVEVAEANCAACHSADYINTQPRGPGFGKDFWQAEVTKMIKVYGAPISDEDAKEIVEYLAKAY